MWGTARALEGRRIGVIVSALALLTGCATSGKLDPDAAQNVVREKTIVDTKSLYNFPERQPLDAAGADTTALASAANAFQIGPGDILHLEVFDDTNLNRDSAVRYDGYVSLPLIDELHVAGQTRTEAENAVREAYKNVFRQPRVSLTVLEPQSKSFFVLGDIASPNEYPYKRPITLLQAINIAGGLRVDTNNSDSSIGAQGQLAKAFIFRQVDGQRHVLEYDLTGIRNPGEHPSQSPVLPGDMVYIPEGVNLVYVMGEVRVPHVYPLIEGMTLLELLARAGGAVEPTARMRGIVLFRKLPDGQTEAQLIDLRRALQTGYSPLLEPGDIVYLPRNPLVRLRDNLMHFTQLTETVSPLLSLYTQAYDAYYTRERFDRLFKDTNNGASALTVLQTISDLTP